MRNQRSVTLIGCFLLGAMLVFATGAGDDQSEVQASAAETQASAAETQASAAETQASAAKTQASAAEVQPGAAEDGEGPDMMPVVMLVVGIVSVLGLIIGLKMNAFLALIISALIVSLMVGFAQDQEMGSRMTAVAKAFGKAAEGIGIVIAMAAIIGKCMLDSGAADRIVRTAVNITGEKKASFGLMLSGFILAVPVFFDTVFYLLVPLARSLYTRTKKHYLRYLLAIATGGAITHTLVPPTPGPLLVSSILGVDIGRMIIVGAMVAFPAAIVGLIYSHIVDAKMPIEMRPLGTKASQRDPLPEDKLPSLWISLLPVVLPVVLIGAGTLATTLADAEDRAKLQVADITDYDALATLLSEAEEDSPAGRVLASEKISDEDRTTLIQPATAPEQQQRVVEILNQVLLDGSFYDEQAFLGVPISDVAKSKLAADQLRMKPVDRRRMNRVLMEDAFADLVKKHDWNTPKRKLASSLSLWSNANFALMVAALIAMLTLKRSRHLSWRTLGVDVEEALMSGGIIILITAAGGAFGAMLGDTKINETIKGFFSTQGGSGIGLLFLGWGIAVVLKVAQGSSTVAMIVGAGMMAAIIGDAKPEFNMVYIATAVGAGSLCGSWMNDSGFWIFTKMGALTESESLKSWTPLLIVLSITSLVITIVLSQTLPMRIQL